ncbi:hypothetical protein ABLAC_16230 [Acinetobacter baumannii LAC-4]|nr:hypothetical protein ABLAC_16230 [Acinetobacter baumannii LAC-4]
MITAKSILDMVDYWLNHPVNGKYGSDFAIEQLPNDHS